MYARVLIYQAGAVLTRSEYPQFGYLDWVNTPRYRLFIRVNLKPRFDCGEWWWMQGERERGIIRICLLKKRDAQTPLGKRWLVWQYKFMPCLWTYLSKPNVCVPYTGICRSMIPISLQHFFFFKYWSSWVDRLFFFSLCELRTCTYRIYFTWRQISAYIYIYIYIPYFTLLGRFRYGPGPGLWDETSRDILDNFLAHG